MNLDILIKINNNSVRQSFTLRASKHKILVLPNYVLMLTIKT